MYGKGSYSWGKLEVTPRYTEEKRDSRRVMGCGFRVAGWELHRDTLREKERHRGLKIED